MIYFSDAGIDHLIKEDVPYIDLTSVLLDLAGKKGKLEFTCREPAVICGTEEVLRIFQKLGITPLTYLPSGARAQPQTSLLTAEGDAAALHMAWRLSVNILEYASGVATRTNRMLARARKVNPKIEVLATRKIIPGTKELAIKAVVAGGGMPHRLGLSETILIFKQHMNFIGGLEGLIASLQAGRLQACEKKLTVEVETIAEALLLCQTGVDSLQLDKLPPAELQKAVEMIRAKNAQIVLLAAGGINENNAEEYARTGVDGLVTSSVYYGRPVNIGATITPVE